MHRSRSMNPQTHIEFKEFRLAGPFIAVRISNLLTDNGIMFLSKDCLYVSHEFHHRLKTNFDEAIHEKVRIIKIDDPAETHSLSDCCEAFSFLNKQILSKPSGASANDLCDQAIRFHEIIKKFESSVPVYSSPFGNYTSKLT